MFQFLGDQELEGRVVDDSAVYDCVPRPYRLYCLSDKLQHFLFAYLLLPRIAMATPVGYGIAMGICGQSKYEILLHTRFRLFNELTLVLAGFQEHYFR